MDELFDTADYSPLFAGLPVPATEDAQPRTRPHYGQAAMCCSDCGAAGPFVRTSDDRSLCIPCARKAQKK